MNKPFCPFPPGFLWGVATSAYQVEGAVHEDGRGASVWDTHSHTPGLVAEGHTGDVAVDHYHRYREDVALMKELGVKAYRFSIAWPRIFPRDSRNVNPRGLDFYSRLVDELLAAGIQPWATLFHWDLPQWCEDEYRGWESRRCAEDFATYAGVIARHLGDRLAGVFTINEFVCFLDLAYAGRPENLAPAKIVPARTLNVARHHAILGHGMAVQAFRAASPRTVPIGLAENVPAAVPVLERPEHISAAKEALRALSGMFLTPIFEGAYPESYLTEQGVDAPKFTDAEMRTISTPLDLLGLNLYTPVIVRAEPHNPRGWTIDPFGESHPKMHMPWLNLFPSVLYWTPRLVSELWKPKAVYVTENGCAAPDAPDADGRVSDLSRLMYLQEHLVHAARATSEGVPLAGYFLWSLLDNFEWNYGYTKRFGVVHVDFATQKRTPKLSAHFYADVIRRNAVGA
jgi:beta-glucosidase